jgi:hypothetical protein
MLFGLRTESFLPGAGPMSLQANFVANLVEMTKKWQENRQSIRTKLQASPKGYAPARQASQKGYAPARATKLETP